MSLREKRSNPTICIVIVRNGATRQSYFDKTLKIPRFAPGDNFANSIVTFVTFPWVTRNNI